MESYALGYGSGPFLNGPQSLLWKRPPRVWPLKQIEILLSFGAGIVHRLLLNGAQMSVQWEQAFVPFGADPSFGSLMAHADIAMQTGLEYKDHSLELREL